MNNANLPDGDHTLIDGSAWFTVKNFSVWIRETDEGVVVDIYAKNKEMCESIGSTYAFDGEAEEIINGETGETE